MDSIKSSLKKWLKLSRIVPLFTILGAGIALVLSLLGELELETSVNIIIALLILIALDALTERISLLEKIDTQLRRISAGEDLKKRSGMISFEEQAGHASEIYLIAVSAVALSTRLAGFFEYRLKQGCNINIVLVDPEAESLQAWELQNSLSNIKNDIEVALNHFRRIAGQKTAGKCKIKLSNVFFPYSLFGVDIEEDKGTMVVEFHTYKTPPSDRPHVFLTAKDHPYWFNFYRSQIKEIWSSSKEISSPKANLVSSVRPPNPA